MAFTKGTRAYTEIRRTLKPLLEGVVFCIDPSIGSMDQNGKGSLPGWAVSRRGDVIDSGVISINVNGTVQQRLRQLAFELRKLYQKWNPDVLVYENITDVPFMGYSARSHASLMKALGAVLSVAGPDMDVGVFASSWKRLVRPTYVKSDENDARELLWIVLQEARRIKEVDLPGRRKKKSR